MLDLGSEIWNSITSSTGSPGGSAAKLLSAFRSGDDSAYDELYHEVCHQTSVSEFSYAAIPHLVDIARSAGRPRKLKALGMVGTMVASRSAMPADAPPLRPEWEMEYEASVSEARRLAADALREPGWESAESQELLAALAALHGHADLAILLFFRGPELECPSCGESITFSR